MLKKVKSAVKSTRGSDFKIAIVAATYNAVYVDGMLNAALSELKKAGVKMVKVWRVPGSYEVPVVVSKLAVDGDFNAIIAFGVILRGETIHASHIGDAVSQALMDIAVAHQKPVIHEVLIFENEEQARVRCLSKDRNRGVEAANTALSMAEVFHQINETVQEF